MDARTILRRKSTKRKRTSSLSKDSSHGHAVTFCLVLGWSLLGLGCTPAPSADERRLLALMQQRLDRMTDVARWKWNEKRPIEDPEREAEILSRLKERGTKRGLDGDFVESFFRDQIEAAKEIQHQAFARWKREGRGSFSEVRPLSELRRQIDAINDQLMDCLGKIVPRRRREVARHQNGLPTTALRSLSR